MNLGMLFMRAAQQHGDKVAIVDDGATLTYRELGQRSTRLANALLGLQVQKGERVALLMPNCHQAVEIDIALCRLGIVKVPLNARVSPRELLAMIADSGASVLFVHDSMAPILAELLEAGCQLHLLVAAGGPVDGCLDYEEMLAGTSEERVVADVDQDDLYALIYTSGTSGILKAAMLTHRNWITLTRSNLMRSGTDSLATLVIAYVAPITHAAGGSLLANLLRGSVNIFFRKFDPDGFLAAVEELGINEVLLVPVMINMLLASPEIRKRNLGSLQSILYGTAPMAPERVRQALEVFGPVLTQGYGQTETCAVTSLLSQQDHLSANDPATAHRLASAGRVNFNCEVLVVDDDGKELPTGEVGEIIVRGDNVMKGYWNAPELTRESLRDGWLYTRDMGRFDEDGYLYLVDRKSDMIITGGFNVYPTEVENALYQHAAVYEAAVISVPDPKWGESVKAVVVLKPGSTATEEDLIGHCRSLLAAFKAPKSVSFVDELPKSSVGKILRRVVREPFWREMDRRIG